jgi:predicted secreted protein
MSGEALHVADGDSFEIDFNERSPAGYIWRLERPVEGIELLGSRLTLPPAGRIGASGTRQFQVRATGPGMYRLVFQLRREWETELIERRTVQVEVT